MRITIAATAGLLLAGRLAAQQPQPDPRWLPWMGCWEREELAVSAAARLTCVLPTATPATVEIVTLSAGVPIARELLTAGDEPVTLDRDGCTGTERVTFAGGGRRIYRTIDWLCRPGLQSTAGHLLAITPEGNWVDVQVMSTLGSRGRRVTRYHVTGQAALPAEIAERLTSVQLPARRARTGDAPDLTMDDVVEAFRAVGADAVESWLSAEDRGFSLDGRQLARAKTAGLPDETIDLMVALTYPHKFRIEDGTQVAEIDEGGGGGYGGIAIGSGIPLYSSYAAGGYDGYGYDPFYYSGYGDWGWEAGPIVVIPSVPASVGAAYSTHGSVVNGRGYSAGPGVVSSRQANPSGAGSSTTTTSGGSGTTSAATQVNAQSGSSTSSAPSSSERSAKPRP